MPHPPPPKKLQLVLFDFSLTGASPENISAGTLPYLDPFLALRRPPRWDVYAERFAVAVTLYQMLTGGLPRWGDGKTPPAMLDAEVSLDSDRFDPHLRDALTRFFEKALRRDYRERFDNAEDMLRAWRKAFEDTLTAPAEADTFAAIAQLATVDTTIADLGYGIEAQNVLEGMGIHSVRDLLAVERVKFRYLTGVGDRIRREIRLKAKRLAQLRPDLAQGRSTLHGVDNAGPGVACIDELAALLLPKRPAGDDRPEERALALYLGLEQAEGGAGLRHTLAQPRRRRPARSPAPVDPVERALEGARALAQTAPSDPGPGGNRGPAGLPSGRHDHPGAGPRPARCARLHHPGR